MALTEYNLPKIQFNKQPDNFSSRMVGETYQQMSPFQWHQHDWNNDGDVHDEKVAKFQKVSDVNPYSPNYFTLCERDFLDLKNEGCIAYVKEQTKDVAPPLADMIARASSRMKQQAGQAIEGLNKHITLTDKER